MHYAEIEAKGKICPRVLTLNFNPYFEPFITLWEYTNPMFQFGRRYYPKVFGFELGYIVNFKLLSLSLGFFELLAFANV